MTGCDGLANADGLFNCACALRGPFIVPIAFDGMVDGFSFVCLIVIVLCNPPAPVVPSPLADGGGRKLRADELPTLFMAAKPGLLLEAGLPELTLAAGAAAEAEAAGGGARRGLRLGLRFGLWLALARLALARLGVRALSDSCSISLPFLFASARLFARDRGASAATLTPCAAGERREDGVSTDAVTTGGGGLASGAGRVAPLTLGTAPMDLLGRCTRNIDLLALGDRPSERG